MQAILHSKLSNGLASTSDLYQLHDHTSSFLHSHFNLPPSTTSYTFLCTKKLLWDAFDKRSIKDCLVIENQGLALLNFPSFKCYLCNSDYP